MYALLEDAGYLVLKTLTEQPQVSAESLGLLVYMSTEQVSSVLSQLERQGYVRRVRGGIDLRSAMTHSVVYSLVEDRRKEAEERLETMREPHRPANPAFGEIRNMIYRASVQFFAVPAMLDGDQLGALYDLIATAKRAEGPDMRYEVESYYNTLDDCIAVLACKDIVMAFGKLRHAYRMFSLVDPDFASFVKFMINGIEILIVSIYGEGGAYVQDTPC